MAKKQQNKVVITVTKNNYSTTLYMNGKVYTEKWKRDDIGSSVCETKEIEEQVRISDELYEALSGFTAFDIMQALNEL